MKTDRPQPTAYAAIAIGLVSLLAVCCTPQPGDRVDNEGDSSGNPIERPQSAPVALPTTGEHVAAARDAARTQWLASSLAEVRVWMNRLVDSRPTNQSRPDSTHPPHWVQAEVAPEAHLMQWADGVTGPGSGVTLSGVGDLRELIQMLLTSTERSCRVAPCASVPVRLPAGVTFTAEQWLQVAAAHAMQSGQPTANGVYLEPTDATGTPLSHPLPDDLRPTSRLLWIVGSADFADQIGALRGAAVDDAVWQTSLDTLEATHQEIRDGKPDAPMFTPVVTSADADALCPRTGASLLQLRPFQRLFTVAGLDASIASYQSFMVRLELRIPLAPTILPAAVSEQMTVARGVARLLDLLARIDRAAPPCMCGSGLLALAATSAASDGTPGSVRVWCFSAHADNAPGMRVTIDQQFGTAANLEPSGLHLVGVDVVEELNGSQADPGTICLLIICEARGSISCPEHPAPDPPQPGFPRCRIPESPLAMALDSIQLRGVTFGKAVLFNKHRHANLQNLEGSETLGVGDTFVLDQITWRILEVRQQAVVVKSVRNGIVRVIR